MIFNILEPFGVLGTLVGGYIVPFLFVLTIVVFFHELGHFLIARWAGVKVLTFSLGFGPKISGSVAAKPEGLLLHENLFYSLRHFGMRQYWRDFESLERWARSEPHRIWWQNYTRDTGGTGLGLSVSAGIVKEHQGRLEFHSEPGQGTTALVALPAQGAST